MGVKGGVRKNENSVKQERRSGTLKKFYTFHPKGWDRKLVYKWSKWGIRRQRRCWRTWKCRGIPGVGTWDQSKPRQVARFPLLLWTDTVERRDTAGVEKMWSEATNMPTGWWECGQNVRTKFRASWATRPLLSLTSPEVPTYLPWASIT